MRAAAAIALVAGFGLLLQTTLIYALPTRFQIAPDILLAVCVFLGLHRHTVGGVVGAFLLGYVEDAVGGGAVGLNAFGMVVVYLLVYLTCRRLWVDNVVSKVVLVFLASWVKTVAVLGVSIVFGTVGDEWGPVLGQAMISAALAAAVAPPVFALLASVRVRDQREAV